MPQPGYITDLADELAKMYLEAEVTLRARLAVLAGTGRQAARLRAMIAAVDAQMAQLEASASGFLQQRLPGIYAAGAADTGLPFAWDLVHVDAVQALAAQNWSELLAATEHVRGDTKAALRALARSASLDVVAAGDTANRAGLELTNFVQDQLGDLFTVTYSNGARHTLADWADTAVRTQTALAYNAGALNQFREYDVGFVECIDGSSCGLETHDDPELANGLVVDIATAEQYPLSHPRCVRSWVASTATTSDDAQALNDGRDMDQLGAAAEAERARASAGTVTGRQFATRPEGARVAGRQARGVRAPRAARVGR